LVQLAAKLRHALSSRAATVGKLLTSLVLPLVAVTHCGPSIQSIHEGSVRFEHCYRLDLDPNIVPAHRHACWEQWMRVYSYGQARDRVEYARRRLGQLEAGDPDPPRLDLDSDDSRPGREFYMSMPAPTDAHAPPPPVATAAKEPAPEKVPGDECIIRCRSGRSACLTSCSETPQPGGPEKQAVDSAASKPEEPKTEEEPSESSCDCEADYKACAMRCFG
jgi:hypothetical protein